LITLAGIFNFVENISKKFSSVKEIGFDVVEWILLAQDRVP
jgi:hypothetical protein